MDETKELALAAATQQHHHQQHQVWRMPQGHYVDAVRWMPPATVWQQSLALALWNSDAHTTYLHLSSLLFDHDSPSLTLHASWPLPARISSLRTLPFLSQQSLVAAGSFAGSISFITTQLLHPSPSALPLLSPSLHKGPVSGLDLQSDTCDCVSVGEDGKINLVKLTESQLRHSCIFDNQGITSFRATQWASSVEFVTAGLGFSLQWWDHRRPGGPAQTTNKWTSTTGAGSIHSLDVHPSRKHVCVVGGSNSTVLAWDLRWQQEPIQLCGPSLGKGRFLGGSMADGDVWEVKYDPFASTRSNGSVSRKIPPVMMCSEDGILGILEAGEAPLEILAEPCAINTFDINPEGGNDVICGLEFESLLYLKRVL